MQDAQFYFLHIILSKVENASKIIILKINFLTYKSHSFNIISRNLNIEIF